MERSDPFRKIEALNDFGQLLQGIQRARTVPMHDSFSHEQAPVAAEQDPIIPLKDLSQFIIRVIVVIETIESQHSQISSQPAEVVVEQKAWIDRTSIWDRMNLNLVAFLRDRAQRLFLAVDQHLADLGMRHSQRFRQMLDGLPTAKVHAQGLLSLIAGQKISQSA